MDVKHMIEQLKAEAAELLATAKVLEKRVGTAFTKGKQSAARAKHGPGKSAHKPHGRVWTPAMKLAMSKKMKARHAAKKTK
jgi:hypothetical protein